MCNSKLDTFYQITLLVMIVRMSSTDYVTSTIWVNAVPCWYQSLRASAVSIAHVTLASCVPERRRACKLGRVVTVKPCEHYHYPPRDQKHVKAPSSLVSDILDGYSCVSCNHLAANGPKRQPGVRRWKMIEQMSLFSAANMVHCVITPPSNPYSY